MEEIITHRQALVNARIISGNKALAMEDMLHKNGSLASLRQASAMLSTPGTKKKKKKKKSSAKKLSLNHDSEDYDHVDPVDQYDLLRKEQLKILRKIREKQNNAESLQEFNLGGRAPSQRTSIGGNS